MRRLTKVGRDIVGYIPLTFLPPGIMFYGIVFFSRSLGPGLFGQFSLVYLSTQMLSFILQGWLAHAIFRFHKASIDPQSNKSQADYKSTVIMLYLLSASVGLLVLYILLSMLGLERTALWFAGGGIYLVSTGLGEIIKAIKRANTDIGSLNLLSLAITAVPVGAGIAYLAMNGSDPAQLLGLFALGKMAALLFYIPWKSLWASTVTVHFHSISKQIVRTFAVYGLPLSLATTGHQIMSVADRYFLEHYQGVAVVGIYSAVYQLFFQVFAIAFSFILSASMPHMVDRFDLGNPAEAGIMYGKTGYLMLLLLAPASGFVIIHGYYLVGLIFGSEYTAVSKYVIQLVTLSAFFWLMTTFQYRVLMLVKMTKYIALSSLFCALLNLLGNALLINKYGMLGAAISTVTAYGILALITRQLVRKYYEHVVLGNLKFLAFLAAGVLAAKIVETIKENYVVIAIEQSPLTTVIYLIISSAPINKIRLC